MSPQVSRNSPCPCGSGRKYKKCCLTRPTDGMSRKELDELPDPGPVTQEMKDATDQMLKEEGYTAEKSEQLFIMDVLCRQAMKRRRLNDRLAVAALVPYAMLGGLR